ncbi:MAG: peptidoglycan DD-metalloendopeptidase family protein [Polyangiaceae bacterium]
MTPSRLPRIRRDLTGDEDTPFLDLPEPPRDPLPSEGRSSLRQSLRQAVPGSAQAPSSPQRARLGRNPAPTPRPGPTSEARPAPSSLNRPPASSVAAQSLRDPEDEDEEIRSRSAYSLRVRDLPLSVARRSSQPQQADSTGRRVEDVPVERAPRPPSRPAEGGALPMVRRPPGPAISPRMTAIFGGLFGLAAITSVVAVLIQAAPPRNDREKMAEAAATSTAAAATPTEAPAKPKKPKREALPSPWRVKEMEKDPTVTLVSGVMEKKSFIDALDEKKIPKAQAYRIMKAFEALRKFDHCGKRDKFTVAVEKSSQRVKAFEYEVSPTEVYQAKEDQNGLLVGSKLDMKIAENEFASAFYVQKDVSKSYEDGGFENGILGSIDEALVGRMSCDAFEEGSTVKVIALEETALGLFAKYKRVLALEYKPPSGKSFRIYYFSGGSSKGYWDDKGKQMYGGGFQKPVPGPVTSPFNPKRMHPVLHTIMPHQGTDLGVPTGTPVMASYKGTVQFIGNGGPAGNLVTILHANGVETGYAHLSRFVPGMKIGDKVGTKQLIGYAGSTGRSTGPHLHFSAKKNGQFFDAMTLLAIDKERVMPPEDRQAFMEFKAEMDKRLDAIAQPEPPAPKPEPKSAPSASASSGPSMSGAPVASNSPAAPTGVATGSSPAEPGIHPSGFQEDGSDDDDEGGQAIPGAALGAGAPPPGSTAKPSANNKDKADPAEKDDDDK